MTCNPIRTVMAQADCRHDIEPRTISFKGARQTLDAFQPLIDLQENRGAGVYRDLYGVSRRDSASCQ